MRELTDLEISEVSGGKNGGAGFWESVGGFFDNPFSTLGKGIDWGVDYVGSGLRGEIDVDWDKVGASGMGA